MNSNVPKLLTAGFLLLLAIILPAPSASAVMFTYSFDWPIPMSIADQKSGNGLDFLLDYTVEQALSDLSISSAKLTLRHEGNSNSGPTNEIWRLLSSQGDIIGDLTSSSVAAAHDIWLIPDAVIQSYIALHSLSWKFYLSEQTPFNGEKIEISHASLLIDAIEPNKDSALVPEPATGFCLLLGLLTTTRIKRRLDDR